MSSSLQCQSRHLKCDLTKPCTACSKARRSCTEVSRYQFRHSRKHSISYPESKKKIGKPALIFEKHQIQLDADNAKGQSSILQTDGKELGYPLYWAEHPARSNGDIVLSANATSPERSSSPRVRVLGDDTAGNPLSKRSDGLWPLSTKDEAFLMRYFVTELSLWFDYCDEERHFSTVVVQAAAKSRILNNALLAVAAKHLSVTRGFDRFWPDRYQRECLLDLIPIQANTEVDLDDTLFAATVILRLFDEMTERDSQSDSAMHIFGSHMLVNAREAARVHSSAQESSLRSATLFIELRQEIHIAFLTNRPPPPLVKYCNIDRNLEPASDWIWAKRIIAHTADILTYCNGTGNKSTEAWTKLMEYLDAWKAAVPPSFKPIYHEAADPKRGRPFPTVWLANDCHTAGLQYMALSTITLLAHDPRITSFGPLRIPKLEDANAQIMYQVRLLCGIAVSNKTLFTTKLVSGTAIAMCGERFTDRVEQEALMEILEETEAHVAWPYLKAQERLKRCWGWEVA